MTIPSAEERRNHPALRSFGGTNQPCWICTNLAPGDLITLDNILGDPLCWPRTIWKDIKGGAPEGGMPHKYRSYGAMQMGREFLLAHGYEYPPNNKGKMRLYRHFRNHVPLQHIDVDALLASGLIAPSKINPPDKPAVEPLDPMAYIALYNQGIQAGLKALGLIGERVQKYLDQGEEVPMPLLKMLLDAGMKLASSQAGIKASGKQFGDSGIDENDGFRGDDEISPRFGSYRVRQIEGKATPVFDEGKADRDHYNEQAAQEGMPPIGGR